MKRAIVTGAGGFIGWHLCKYLIGKGYWIRGVDKKMPEFAQAMCDEFELYDLRDEADARYAMKGSEGMEVYHLAADMGGIGFISSHLVDCALNNSRIDNAVIGAVLENGCQRFVYSSSACVYRQDLQGDAEEVPRLSEEDAWPADPERGYGLQKLYTEELLRYCAEERRLQARVARFHNVFGPYGTWRGGREKAPAALCRKVAMATVKDPVVEVWGDGKAQRSYLYVDDVCRGIYALAQYNDFLIANLGSEENLSVRALAELIAAIAGKTVDLHFGADGYQGVRSRSCDGGLALKMLGWEPKVSLTDGLLRTYQWIDEQVTSSARSAS